MIKTPPESLDKTLADLSFFDRLWTGIKAWLKRDALVIILYVSVTLLMTYPLAFKLGGQWLAFRNPDTYVKLWDNWWLREHAFGSPSLLFTDLQFYPNGLDLTFHSISWTVALMSWVLTGITDAITAYNLTILVAVFSTAYAAYLLARPYVAYGASAWLAGAVYSFAPYHIAHSGGHPDLVHLAPIPLAALLLINAVTRTSLLAALGAALMVGLASFTSLYIMTFALITLGPILVVLLLDKRRWTEANIWPVVATFILTSGLLLAMRLAPIFLDAGGLNEAIETKQQADVGQTDLLAYVLPSHLNPLFTPYTKEIASRMGYMSMTWPAYLGIVPLVLAAGALTWKKHRRLSLTWLLVGITFVVLSLGPVLRFNGTLYENFRMPAQLLLWFPPIRAIGRPDLFVMGVLLPLAVLAGIGFDRLMIAARKRRKIQIALMIALPGLLLLEYWSGEYPLAPAAAPPFYEQLADEPGDFAIIQLPMGRNASKRYTFLQTIHQRPIVEGLSARTLAESYRYIEGNPLLRHWFQGDAIDCDLLSGAQAASAVDELTGDGFRYVVIHHPAPELLSQFDDYFQSQPAYQDNALTAYNLSELRVRPHCPAD